MPSNNPQRKPARQILFILGMHRSGTSALGGVLSHLGAKPPKSLMAPNGDNPKGYWESVELMRLHDRILSSAGSRWNDWSCFNPDWIESPVAESFRESLVPLLEREYGDAPLLLVKDPRISRFFPLWREALEGTDFIPKVLLPLRHPQAVAQSLSVRNHFGRHRSLLLWLRHMLEAEASTRDLKRSFVPYDALLDDWQAQARRIAGDLDLRWPAWSGDSEAKIDEFLSSELRHHGTPEKVTGSEEFSGWADAAWECLGKMADGQPEAPLIAELDRIKKEFDRTSAIYAAVVREHETRVEGLYAKGKAQLAEANEKVSELTAGNRDMHATLSVTRKALADREAELASQLTRTTSLEDTLDSVRVKAVATEAALEARLAEVEATRSELASDRDRLVREIEATREEREAIVAELEARTSKADERAATLESALEQAELAQHQAEASVAQRFQETAKLTELVFRLEQSLADKDAAARNVAAEHARWTAMEEFRIATLRSRLTALEGQRESWRAFALESRSALAALRGSRAGRMLRPVLRIPDPPAEPPADNELDHAVGLLRQSQLFDPDWYRETYLGGEPESDPFVHYLREGALDGFDPGPGFDTVGYLVRYADVRRSGVNPLVHFLAYGKDEGRMPTD